MTENGVIKHFQDGEALLAEDTNDNNDEILSRLSSGLSALRTEVVQMLASAGLIPAGFIGAVCTRTIPPGFLKCDGSILLRADYADLFSAIGTAYGSTDSTNFKLPDFQGCFLRGYGGNSSTLGSKQESAAPNITGWFQLHNTTEPSSSAGGAFAKTSGSASSYGWDASMAAPQITFDASRISALYQEGIEEIRPDNYAVNWIIKY